MFTLKANILLAITTIMLLLCLLPNVDSRSFDTQNNNNNQRLNTLNNYNLNQTGYRPRRLRQTGSSFGFQRYTPNYNPFMDLKGKYCEIRRGNKCCDNRLDECHVEIMGTLCYCDDFCDRIDEYQPRNPPDCCPDFHSHCRGIRTTTTTTTTQKPTTTQIPDDGPGVVVRCAEGSKCTEIGRICKLNNCNNCTCQSEVNTTGNVLKCETDPCMISENALRNMTRDPTRFTWTSSNYSEFWGHKAAEGHEYWTGAIKPQNMLYGSTEMKPVILEYNENELPANFDATKPPRSHIYGAGKVGGIRNQNWCGSSWALSTLGVAEDRLAISAAAKNLTIITQLSPQQLISCDTKGQRNRGCKKGYMDVVWNHLRHTGVVTESCFPYVSSSKEDKGIPECPFPVKFAEGSRSFDRSKLIQCPKPPNGNGQDSRIYQFEPAFRIANKETDIMYEIWKNGPVQALMKVRDDFFMYQSGIYSHDIDLVDLYDASYHVVRIVGWGTEGFKNIKFWIIANTWGTDWGEKGFFKIRRGSNESEIESLILAVRPQLHKIEKQLAIKQNLFKEIRNFGK